MSVLIERHLVDLIIKLFLVLVLLLVVIVLERVQRFPLFLHVLILLMMARGPTEVLVLVVVQIGPLANIQHVSSIHH